VLVDPDLVAQQVAGGLGEQPASVRPARAGVLHHTVEAQQRIVVEHDRIEIGGIDEAFLEAVVDGIDGKRRVVLPAREALFLRGGDDLAVAHQRRRRVVYTGDAKYIHAIHSDSRKVCIRCII